MTSVNRIEPAHYWYRQGQRWVCTEHHYKRCNETWDFQTCPSPTIMDLLPWWWVQWGLGKFYFILFAGTPLPLLRLIPHLKMESQLLGNNSIHNYVVHRKVDWRTPNLESLWMHQDRAPCLCICLASTCLILQIPWHASTCNPTSPLQPTGKSTYTGWIRKAKIKIILLVRVAE